MVRRLIWVFFFYVGTSLTATAQDTTLRVQLNRPYFKSGDTIFMAVSQANKKNATLFLRAEHEKGFVWEMRWPMLGGESEPSLIIPDSFPQGQYRLFFSVQENLFTIFGRVKSPANVKELGVILLTSATDVYESTIPVGADNRFTYKNVLFENEATILFTSTNRRTKDKLDIEISTVLDSAAAPLRNKTVDIFIGDQEPSAEVAVRPFSSVTDTGDGRTQTLAAVTVYNKPLSRGEIYNKQYSRGLFNDMNERVFNFLDDNTMGNSFSLLQFLTGRVAGLMISFGPNPSIMWRGQAVTFYLDEMRTDPALVDGISMMDIAMVKVYPPPFFGNPGGSGGAIAVYTKRGEHNNDNYRNGFKVRGYTPMDYKLPTMPDKF